MNASDKKNHPVAGFLVIPKIEPTVEFVKTVFGGVERERYQAHDGKTWYSVMEVDGSPLNLMEQFPSMGLYAAHYRPAVGGDTSMLAVSVKDVDATFKRAIASGATSILEPQVAYWGDRYAEFRAPSGVRFSCCGPVDKLDELVDPPELTRRFEEFQKEHGSPTTPANIVKVNKSAIVNTVPAVHVALDAKGTALTAESKEELSYVADYLKENPKKNIVIVGHAEASSGDQMALSERMAAVVAKELSATYGIASSRIKAQGAGDRSPITSNLTEEGRAINRRIVIVEE